jgi:5-methylcytosine-specific restriction enzyme A
MFQIGVSYSRRADIHDRFGGQRQGGISTPVEHPFVFLFTGSSGDQFGYEDGWQADEEVFLYTGEGQVGDMSFRVGNLAIRNHALNGKSLLLFEALGKSRPVVFKGEFECAGYDFPLGPDRDGNLRKTIRFHLLACVDSAPPIEKNQPVTADLPIDGLTLAELRRRAMKAISPDQETDWREAKICRRQRSDAIRRYVLARAKGICELTGDLAPFVTKTGEPYLEVHHLNRRSDGGLDDPRNCAAITPTAHREIHYGKNGELLNEKLSAIIRSKENSF